MGTQIETCYNCNAKIGRMVNPLSLDRSFFGEKMK